MPRVKRGVASRARRKKILRQAKGYYGARSRTFKVAKQAVIKPDNTRTEIGARRNDNSEHCGLFGSMPKQESTDFRTVALLRV